MDLKIEKKHEDNTTTTTTTTTTVTTTTTNNSKINNSSSSISNGCNGDDSGIDSSNTTTTTTTTTTNSSSSSSPLLVSFGNPLLDITAVVKDDALHRRFQLPVDGQLEVTEQQRPVFTHVMQEYPVEYTAGGCALNSSRVFCWVLGEPHRVVFVGGIGKDEAAGRLSSIVEESGVISRFVVVEEQPTGVCVALVLGACRCLCADIGAAATCLPEHVFAPHLRPVLEEAQFIYVEGYFITHSFPAALQIARYAQQQGKTLVFNLCGSYVCENQSEELRQLLPFVDILFGFVEEYKTLDLHVDVAALSAGQCHAPDNIAHHLLLVLQAMRGEAPVLQDRLKDARPLPDHGPAPDIMQSGTNGLAVPNGEPDAHGEEHGTPDTPGTPRGRASSRRGTANGCREGGSAKQRLVVVTKGPSPLLYSRGGEVRQRPVPPISPGDIVDTTGAGDSFVGGFLAALSRGRPLDQCLDCGVWTAQQLLRQKGCTLPPGPADFLATD